MANDKHQEAARRLREAYTTGAVAPLRDCLDPVDIAGAYAVQEINTRFWEAQGRHIVGRKAGLTAKAVQAQLGVDQPDFGVLFEDMQVSDGGRLDPFRCLQAKAEAEIAFILGADLPSPVSTPAEVAAAVSTVHAAIEIVDNGADYQIQNILGYDNAAIAFPYVYLFNSDTSLYHKVMVAGAGTEAGLTIDSTGTADPPLGRRLRYMVMWNSDDGMYRIVRCTGVDTSIGLQLDVAATDEIYVGTAAPTANPGYGGIPGTAKWYVNLSSGAVYVWTGTAWQAIIAEP